MSHNKAQAAQNGLLFVIDVDSHSFVLFVPFCDLSTNKIFSAASVDFANRRSTYR